MRRARVRFASALAVALVLVALSGLFAVLWGLLATPVACAHVPAVERPGRGDSAGTSGTPYPRAQRIEEPDRSLAIYGFLAPDEAFDAFTFTVPQGVVTDVELLVPARGSLAAFAPELTVVSSVDGTIAPHRASSRERFYEPFSLTSFWRVGRTEVIFAPGRRYYFVVSPGAGATSSGAYVIAVGGAEAFTGTDIAETFRVLPVIWTGAWSGGPARPEAWICLGAGLLVTALVVGLVVGRRRRRRAGPPR